MFLTCECANDCNVVKGLGIVAVNGASRCMCVATISPRSQCSQFPRFRHKEINPK